MKGMSEKMVHGDWVVYESDGKREIGRVAEIRGDRAFVCYSHGCTAACTPISLLRPYDRERDYDLVPDMRIGYYRFWNSCPDAGDCYMADKCKPAMTRSV